MLVYFPKGLAEKLAKRSGASEKDGLRFLFLTAADSQPAQDKPRKNQHVELIDRIELAMPITAEMIAADSVLSSWPLARGHFKNAGTETDPVVRQFAQPLWRLILEHNPEIEETLAELLQETAPEPAAAPAPVPIDLVSPDRRSPELRREIIVIRDQYKPPSGPSRLVLSITPGEACITLRGRALLQSVRRTGGSACRSI